MQLVQELCRVHFLEMAKEYVKFWQGWMDSIDELPSEKDKGELALAIVNYAFKGEKYQGKNPTIKAIMALAMKTIDTSNKNANSGQKGAERRYANSGANSDAIGGANSDANGTKDNRHIDIKTIDNRLKTKDSISDNTKSKRTIFVKPTIEQVKAYCFEKGYNINAEYFVDYYEARGWLIGKNPMKNWQAAVRTWVSNGNSNSNAMLTNRYPTPTPPQSQEPERHRTLEEINNAMYPR